MSIYEYTVLDKEDNEVSLEKFKDYVVLIVNTATECGFTPQYTDLARLYDESADRLLELMMKSKDSADLNSALNILFIRKLM